MSRVRIVTDFCRFRASKERLLYFREGEYPIFYPSKKDSHLLCRSSRYGGQNPPVHTPTRVVVLRSSLAYGASRLLRNLDGSSSLDQVNSIRVACMVLLYFLMGTTDVERPIQTYQSQGVSKEGVRKSDHAIIYTCYTSPKCRPDEKARGYETDQMRQPICVMPSKPFYKFDWLSRINYAKTYTVEHNVKVEDFGMVMKDFWYLLESSFQDVFCSRTATGTMPTSMQPAQAEQPYLAGIGAHSSYEYGMVSNETIEEELGPAQSDVPASANLKSTSGSHYDVRTKGKEKDTDEKESDRHPPHPQYFSPSTNPLESNYGGTTPTRQDSTFQSPAHDTSLPSAQSQATPPSHGYDRRPSHDYGLPPNPGYSGQPLSEYTYQADPGYDQTSAPGYNHPSTPGYNQSQYSGHYPPPTEGNVPSPPSDYGPPPSQAGSRSNRKHRNSRR